MSLAILPSAPMPYGPASVPTLLQPMSSKRPKLTLKTIQAPTLLNGKGSTSLRLETLSAVSPTARNTFSNAYDPAQAMKATAAKPQRPCLTPLATSVPFAMSRIPTPLETDIPSLTNSATSSSAVSTTSMSTVDFLSTDVPYKLGYNLTSILSNGPLPRTKRNRTSYAQSRPIFPATKRVSFRAHLTEDIINTKYTVAHSDIESSALLISTTELLQPELGVKPRIQDERETNVTKAGLKITAPTSPQIGVKRESSDEEDSDICPATPVAGRRKKHRQWRWTLGSVGHVAEEARSDDDLLDDDGAK
ncbi:hypothetical protein LTR36_010722 [Oleoguttula mirabilis]|uniref:Glucan 1,4-alpha-glucosidase n=1 Tax=Oleoguttula mirabilis TaxID=1507867 RepID=A0AAV9JSL9_9PEZI|nr:hypothetical protein LTR36_010722 [Oleoguttula mirabilis]